MKCLSKWNFSKEIILLCILMHKFFKIKKKKRIFESCLMFFFVCIINIFKITELKIEYVTVMNC